MEIKINQKALKNVVQKAMRAISRSVLVEAECLLLSASENKLEVTGVGEICIKTSIDCEVVTQGKILINGEMLYNIVCKLPENIVKIKKDNDNTFISCLKSNFKLSNFDVERFPLFPSLSTQKTKMIINSNNLRECLKNTVSATSKDESKMILTGCYLEAENSQLNVVALDGYRLAYQKTSVENTGDSNFKFKMIIPANSAKELIKLIQGNQPCEISSDGNLAIFKEEETFFFTRLINFENFIEYNKFIFSEFSTSIKVKTSKFKESLSRVGTLLDSTMSRIDLFVKKDFIMFLAACQTGISDEEFSELESLSYVNDIDISFNINYLKECLDIFQEEEIIFKLNNNVSPCIMQNEEGSKIYMILPVRRT